MSFESMVLSYLALAVTSVIVLSILLRRHGRVFIEEMFPGRPQAASALVALLDVGFYLLNLGYMSLQIGYARPEQPAPSPEIPIAEAIRTVAVILGFQYLLIGGLHMVNLKLFSGKIGRAMRRAEIERQRATSLPSGEAAARPA